MQVQLCSYIIVAICLINVNVLWSHYVDEKGKKASAETKHQDDKKNNTSKDNVLLVSFDAFGWKYLDLVDTPVLDTFKTQGVYADYVINVIPTETFPNHVSLATGLYPESHGIISNEMYDPVLKKHFNMSVTDPEWWWHEGVKPIWHTNEKQGGISGVVWWPGYNIKNYTPTYSTSKTNISYKQRVDLALSWLKSEKPPNFLMLYFEDLDHAGHNYGFGSPETLEEVRKIDNITGYLIEQLKKNNLLDKWNIILTADHGMTNLSRSRVINITDYVNTSECSVNGDGGVHFVWPKKGMKDTVYKKLEANHHPNTEVYLKEDFPEKYHYRNNRRVPPILVTVDKGWTLVNHPKKYKYKSRGGHGYLNTYPSMWPIFFARGPAFKQGYHSKSFNSVDLYPLMCKLLKIKANPNNGSYSAVEPLLVASTGKDSSISPILIGVMVSSIFFALGILICSVTICVGDRKVKKFRTNRAWNNNMVMSQLEQSDKLLLNGDDGDDDDDEDEFVPARSDTF